jgi:hypothetical protein
VSILFVGCNLKNVHPTSLKRYKNVYSSCIYTVHWNQVSSWCTCSVYVYDPYSVSNTIEFSYILIINENSIILMTEYGSYTCTNPNIIGN